MEITINIPGLSELTTSINVLANALGQAANTGTVTTPSAGTQSPNLTLVPPAPPQPTTAVPVTQQQVTQPTPEAIPNIPTTTQSYTLEQLAVAATQLMDAGRRNELVQLLTQFGVQALTALPKEQYGTFATQLRAMGAKI